jgi:predicted  nucleic acid-binding Zn-ribbon protein
MKPEIETMIELQRYWDAVLKSLNEIERLQRSIVFWKESLKEKQGIEASLKDTIRQGKATLKAMELQLSETEGKITKLELRRKSVQTERELTAVTSELDLLYNAKGSIEDESLTLMDTLEESERSLEAASRDLLESQERVARDIESLQREIAASEAVKNENEDHFNILAEKLPVSVKSKFLRLIQSKEGRAIGEVRDEICASCNFKIPPSLAQESARGATVCVCTNCGRFIYSRS